jgi:hypothetical protein
VIDSLCLVLSQLKCAPIHSLKLIYEQTKDDSKLRLLFLHLCSLWISDTNFEKHPLLFPHEILLELASLLAGGAEKYVSKARKEVNFKDWSLEYL